MISQQSLSELWHAGYSIAELWGFTPHVNRATSETGGLHGLMWGILRVAEDQIDKGAGHRYLRQRIAAGDWIGVGLPENHGPEKNLVVVPRLADAKFGRRQSAVGDGHVTFVDVRFVHRQFWERTA